MALTCMHLRVVNGCCILFPGAPFTYFNDGVGGLSAFIGSEIFTKGDFYWVYERHQDFLSHKKKTVGFFGGVAKKGLRDFFGCAKKSCDFLG